MRRSVAAVAVTLVTALSLSACGSSASSPSSTSDLPTKVIDITFTGSDVTPNGTDIDVKVGQPIELDVTADKPGEIHVHSSPEEQEFEYHEGSSTFHIKPIPAPGRTTVESHTLEKTLFILVAR
jgi:ABC-type glycerol-3-phosphate transport system substrate-binding protein